MTLVKFIELAPYWWYAAGSLCFFIGTVVVILRSLN